MKKFLSILIAISLIISMLPVAFADGETGETPVSKTYEFNSGTTGSVALSTIVYTDTRNWKYLAMADVLADKEDAGSGKIARVYPKTTDGIYFAAIKDVAVNFALALRAPETSGFYIPSLAWYSGSSGSKELDWFMNINDINNKDEKKFEDYAIAPNLILENESVTGAKSYTSSAKTAIYSVNGDELATAFSVTANKIYKFNSITLNPILNPVMTTTVDGANTVSIDLTDTDTTNDTATASTTVSGKTVVDSAETIITDMPVSNNFITYKSSKPEVATVADDGTITAVGNGTATIYAVTSDEKYSSIDSGITVNVTALDVVEPEEGLSGVTVVYDISAARDNGGIDDFKKIDYAFTNGFFEYAGNSLSQTSPDGTKMKNVGTKGEGRNGLRLKVETAENYWWALKIKVPASGKYTPKATYWKYGGRGNNAESYMDYYLIKDDGSDMTSLLSDENLTPSADNECYIGEKLSVDSTLTGGQSIAFDETFNKYIDLKEGEYYLVYKTRNVSGSANFAVASNFTLDGGIGSVPMFCVKSSADEITAGKTTATVTASAKLSKPTVTTVSATATTYTFADATLTDVTYSVAEEDAEVASVTSAGVVSGKSYGVATINASAKCGEENLSDSLEISVVTPPVLDKEITYEEETHTGGKAAVTTYKFVENTPELIETKSDIALGSKVKVSADETIEKDGVTYNFLYWAKGATMAKKQIVSEFAEFDYLPGEGANYLIAVYEEENPATTTVEFYNGNGQLLPTYALDEGKLPDYPSMAGYGTAYGWALKNADGTYTEYRAGDDVSELSGNLMFAAMYEELKADITVFVNGTARTVKYGDTVTCTPDSSKGTLMYWMKNGSVVSLEDTYSFLAWEDCRVEAVYGTNKPELGKEMRKILLDRFAAGEEMAIMAEFIGFDDAVEKGIMFGNQKIAMSSNSSQFTVLDDATTKNTAYGYAIIPDGTGYKILTDGIAHIGVDEEEILSARRQIAVDYMREMATVLWTPSEDITYTTGSSANALSFTLEKGKVYRGVPYAYNSGSLETFMEFENGKDANGVYTISGLSGEALSGGQGMVRLGNDCSGSVVRAWSLFGANIPAKATSNMTAKNGFIKVGDYNDLGITSYSSDVQTTEITDANGKDVMFAAYAELKPADAVVHYLDGYGHVMMISEVDVSRQKVKIIDQTRAHMKTWGTENEDTMQIDGVGTVYNIYGEDVEYSFDQLYNYGYLPITCRELREANYIADKATFRDTLGEESHTLRNLFLGTIHSTKAIDSVKVEILSGNEVRQNATASVARANIFAFDMQQFVTDNKAAIRGTGIDINALESGEYTCKVTVYLTTDTVGTTVRDFTFTK